MEIALVVLSIISLSFMIAYVAVVKRLNAVSEGFSKLLISYNMILEDSQTKEAFLASPEDQDIHKENFIKFLSDSRDWAFDYIDKVQKGLKEFIDIADKEFAYFDSFGILTEQYPNYKAMKTLSSEYKKLKDLLPEDSNDRR
jgi:hypothetical protein